MPATTPATRRVLSVTCGLAAVAGLSLLSAGPALAALAAMAARAAPAAGPPSYIGGFHRLTTIGSTRPVTGDVSPRGVAVIKRTHGGEHAGSVLVSNTRGRRRRAGTGSTIVQISRRGHRTLFAHITGHLPGACPGGVGLTTALAVLHGGWVVAGSAPSRNGRATGARAGCLLFLNNHGQVRETISGHGIDGPWDLTAVSVGSVQDLFVTNVLNGTAKARGKVVYGGTVLRLRLSVHGHKVPQLLGVTKVASGLAEQASPREFVLGPAGVGVSPAGTLYVASTKTSAITAIRHAIRRTTSAHRGVVVSAGKALREPFGLAIAPDNDILTVNRANGLLVETTVHGKQIATRRLDRSGHPAGAGALSGLARVPHSGGVYYTDDASTTLRLLH